MDAPASPLVITKLHVPARRSRNIHRQRLVDCLAPDRGTRLILVCAPAGYGKTTLLAEWAGSLIKRGSAVAWYSLDPPDDDPVLFGSYLIASFIQALGPIPELAHLAQLLRSSTEIDLQRILPTILNVAASCGKDCTLILDDYHLITSPAVHSAIAYLLGHLPENLRIAIGSRSDPPLSLARMRVQGHMLEIRAAHLRFTEDETTRFLNDVMRLDLSPAGVAALEERTEGWIAGLQLAALSLSGSQDKDRIIDSFAGSHRYLVEYLMEEVVNRQPLELQTFLLSTSILERMSAPLCDALLGNTSQSDKILSRLEQANLFVVPLDDQGQWYRYHHLFRDFLQARLRKTQPDRIASLHRSASEWLAESGSLREAAAHSFQVRDWEHAAVFVEQHSFTLILHSDIATVYEWTSAFPEEVMAAHPMLCILQAMALAYRFRRQVRARVEDRLRLADQVLSRIPDKQAVSGLIDMASVVRTFLAMAPDPAVDPQDQLSLARAMLDRYPEGGPGRFSGVLFTGYAYLALNDAQAADLALEEARSLALCGGLFFGIVESTFHLARLAHARGQLHRSAEICRQGKADIAAMLPHPVQDLPALGCLDVALGCVLLEQDRLDEAEKLLHSGLDRMGWGMNPYYLMTAYTALFRLAEVRGQSDEALGYLSRLEEIWPDLSFYTGGLRAVHTLRTSPDDSAAMNGALAWSQDFQASLPEDFSLPGMGPIGAAEAYYQARLAWIHIRTASGNRKAALADLERQISRCEANGLTARVIDLSLLEALAAHSGDDVDRAWTALERAVTTTRAEGFLRSFDQGPALTALLKDASRQGVCRGLIDRILAVIALFPPTQARTTASGTASPLTPSVRLPETFENLSERELDVLRLMAQGASNQDIADRLVITVGTVKSHINHILGKLAARNRTEAVARARENGLLDL